MSAPGLTAPKTLSQPLQELLGVSKPIPRTEVISCLWKYIRKHELQDAENKRNIKGGADPKWARVFGKDTFSMFEMNKKLGSHLT